MPRDKTANHIKIIAAAKAEFMEMGFDKSSMRSIAERCGMTAAGIYRHCVDKADLFDQIVAPAVDRINAWLDAHVARYVNAVHHEERIQWRDSEIDMMREIIYPNIYADAESARLRGEGHYVKGAASPAFSIYDRAL